MARIDDPPATRAGATTSESPPLLKAAGDQRTQASLMVVHSPEARAIGERLNATEAVIALGRDVDPPGFRLEDPQLSRIHFRIVYDARAGSHRIGDAGSRNGTFVDGARIDSAVLHLGCVVRAGASVFVYAGDDWMQKARSRLAHVAASDLAILLLGETGTGKERLARAAHDQSGRAGAFIAVNCGALPKELIVAELFGHTRGAFSGAGNARRGLFQAAAEGTLFLDEVAELPLELQAVLLRALQEGAVRPIGADEEIRVDARIVAATHQRLPELVAAGRFRADLYARLAHIIIEVPPLRHRSASVLSIARAMAAALGSELRLDADAAEALTRYEWPFNVRELDSLVRAFIATEPRATMDFAHLCENYGKLVAGFRKSDSQRADGAQQAAPRKTHRDRGLLEDLLMRHRGNVSSAAEELGKPRAQLYRWLRAMGLDPARFRELD